MSLSTRGRNPAKRHVLIDGPLTLYICWRPLKAINQKGNPAASRTEEETAFGRDVRVQFWTRQFYICAFSLTDKYTKYLKWCNLT